MPVGTGNDSGTGIQLVEADGFVACGSLPIEEGLYVGDRYYHSGALGNRRFTVRS